MIRAPCSHKVAGFDVPWTEIVNVLYLFHAEFVLVYEQCVDNKQNLSLERKVGLTERPRSLNPDKAVPMVIFPIKVYFPIYSHDSYYLYSCSSNCEPEC